MDQSTFGPGVRQFVRRSAPIRRPITAALMEDGGRMSTNRIAQFPAPSSQFPQRSPQNLCTQLSTRHEGFLTADLAGRSKDEEPIIRLAPDIPTGSSPTALRPTHCGDHPAAAATAENPRVSGKINQQQGIYEARTGVRQSTFPALNLFHVKQHGCDRIGAGGRHRRRGDID